MKGSAEALVSEANPDQLKTRIQHQRSYAQSRDFKANQKWGSKDVHRTYGQINRCKKKGQNTT